MDRWSETTARSIFLVACGLVALIGLWFDLQPYACPVPDTLLAIGSKPPPCFEFWFNRYQNLIGAAATLIAAAWTLRGVRRQISVSSVEAAVALVEVVNSRLIYAGKFSDQVQSFIIEDAGCSFALRSARDHSRAAMYADDGGLGFEDLMKARLDDAISRYRANIALLERILDGASDSVARVMLSRADEAQVGDFFMQARTRASFHGLALAEIGVLASHLNSPEEIRVAKLDRVTGFIDQHSNWPSLQEHPVLPMSFRVSERLRVLRDNTLARAES